MKQTFVFLLLLTILKPALAQDQTECKAWPAITKKACHRLHQIFYEGKNELYFTGYSWHNRYLYDSNRISTYNELAWGGGLGKGLYDEDGDYHGVTAFAFLDSHKNVEPIAGYVFVKMHHFNEASMVGAGYSVFLTGRPDIFHGIPFPGALPWVYLGHKQLTLCMTYIPGSRNVGNVLFAFLKWTF